MAVLLLFFSVTAYAEYFIDINIPEYKLRLYEDDKLVKIYPIAVGRSITPSILGDFQIATKVKNPTWYPVGKEPVLPGPDNPLGPWWLGLDYPGYGIHGNNSPSSIGKAQSKGCIRMLNEDVEYLAQRVAKGTPVRLRYDSLIAYDNEVFKIAVFDDLYDLGVNTPNNLRRFAKHYGYTIDAPNWVLEEFLKNSRGKPYPLPKTIDLKCNYELSGYGYEIAEEIVMPIISLSRLGLEIVKEKDVYLVDGKPINRVLGKGVPFTYLKEVEDTLWLKIDINLDSQVSLNVYQATFRGIDCGRVLYKGKNLINVTEITKELGSVVYINPTTQAAMIDGQLVLKPYFYKDELYLSEADIADYLALGVLWDQDKLKATVDSLPVYLFGQRLALDGYFSQGKIYLPILILEQLDYYPEWVDRIAERAKIGEEIIKANRARGHFYISSDDFSRISGITVVKESAGILVGQNHTDTDANVDDTDDFCFKIQYLK